jgi:Fe2+ or Zn2+ uptake regulation protein
MVVRTSCRSATDAPTVDTVRSPQELTAAFRAQGLKVTPQRQLLFRLLHANTAHPSAEALYLLASEQMPGISLRTVYQTLNDLAAMGELRQLTLDAGSARFDPNVDEHHHVVCRGCGDVHDVYLPEAALAASVDGALGLDGFHVRTTTVVLHGTCARCQGRTDADAG